jgi:predicted nuclease of restriction endonuclease-like RecB superfamily
MFWRKAATTVQPIAKLLYRAVMLMTTAVGDWKNFILGIKVQNLV